MTRFTFASRSRPEIDLPHYLGEYEFSVVPRSLFSTDGKLLPTNDKSTLLREIEQLIEKQDDRINKEKEHSVIIFDGMAVANKINIRKSPQIKTYKEDYARTSGIQIRYKVADDTCIWTCIYFTVPITYWNQEWACEELSLAFRDEGIKYVVVYDKTCMRIWLISMMTWRIILTKKLIL